MTIVLAALLAAGTAAISAPRAEAAPASLLQATSSCWLDVINDWLDNNQVDKLYAPACYTQAIQHLNGMPDVRGYSSAIDDIHRALLAALREERGDGPGGLGGGGSGGNSSGGSNVGGGGTNGGGGPTSGSQNASGSTQPFGGTASATSIPLPLIVLGGLAILLALAALGTWLARRYQSRRPSGPRPNPAVAKRRT